MRTRTWGLVLTFIAALMGLIAWRAWPTGRSEPFEATQPRAPRNSPSAVSKSIPTRAAITTNGVAAADAETILRRLEPLAVTDKPAALALALDADSTLPETGVFAEARRALIVTLLVDLNRMSEARARARQFTAQYPLSRYAPLVQGVTGVHPRPRPSEMRDARASRP